MNEFLRNQGRGAKWETKQAALSGDFGMQLFRRKFGEHADKLLTEFGTYSRGPRKGLPRGYIYWQKVTEGGWGNRTPFARFPSMGVLRPGSRCFMVSLNAMREDACIYLDDLTAPRTTLNDNTDIIQGAHMLRFVNSITLVAGAMIILRDNKVELNIGA